MNASVHYDRSPEERAAEIAADEIAQDGKWAEFAGQAASNTIPEIHTISTEAAQSIEERRLADRYDARQILVSKGFPYGLIDLAIDKWCPPADIK